MDGVLRNRDGVLERLLHVEGEPVTVRAWVAGGAVRLRGRGGERGGRRAPAIERMRFALGVDHDLRPFQRAFHRDRLLGPVIRRQPWLRPRRRPEPFEAFAWAVTEQLIDVERAFAIQRRDRRSPRAAQRLRTAARRAVGRRRGAAAPRPSSTPAGWRRNGRSR